MDPVTAIQVATGVIGLVPICADGFDFIASVFNAKQDFADAASELEVDRLAYTGWKNTLGIDGISDTQATVILQRKVPEAQYPVVLGCLVGISNAFINAKFMDSCGLRQTNNAVPPFQVPDLPTYSADPTAWKRDTKTLIEQRKTHMSLVRRCRFVLQDAKKIAALSDKLRRYLSTILNFSTWHFSQTFWNVSMPEQFLKPRLDATNARRDPSEMVQQLGKSLISYDNEAKRAGLDLLSRAAAFTAEVKNFESEPFNTIENSFRVNSRQWSVPKQENEIGTMALGPSKDLTSVYYIEWKSYRTYGGVTEKQLIDNIGNLVKLASISAPTEFRLLQCQGAFKAGNQRYGLVYDLPSHLKSIQEEKCVQGAVSKLRKPNSLLSMIQNFRSSIPEELDLGARIGLVRQVAQSLLLLHAVGWVHKNICSQSIFFFLARSTCWDGPSTTGRFDFDHPYICGFGESRPDDSEDDNSRRDQRYPYEDKDEPSPQKMRMTDADENNPIISTRTVHNFVPKSKQAYPPRAVQAMAKNPYLHPHKRMNPHSLYRSTFDVYSLGCVMLEVGLWQDISTMNPYRQHDPERFRGFLIENTWRALPGIMGKIYAEATRACLQICGTGSNEEQDQKVLHQVIEDLSRCVI